MDSKGNPWKCLMLKPDADHPIRLHASSTNFLDITFTCNHILRQIQFQNSICFWRLWVFQFFYNQSYTVLWSSNSRVQMECVIPSIAFFMDGRNHTLDRCTMYHLFCGESYEQHDMPTVSAYSCSRCHIDLGTKHFLSVCIFAFHPRCRFSSTLLFLYGLSLPGSEEFHDIHGSDLLSGHNRGFAFLNQLYSSFHIHLSEIVRCKKQSVFPVCTKPFDICLAKI